MHFRKCIGEEGAHKILKLSISLFDSKEVNEKEILIDTTVQEKNITFPTGSKLHKKIIEGYRKIAEKENIKLRQQYTRIVKQLMIDQRFRVHPRRKKKANAAARKLKTIAGRMVRDVERKLDDIDRLDFYDEQLWLYYLVLRQKRDDNNKLYSFHAPEVKCISKGKEHKKYEFGNKSCFALTKKEKRERFLRRASIEPIIGHIKQDHRLLRNYLKGTEGDMINTLLAGAAFNIMKMLRKIRESVINVLNEIIEKMTWGYRNQLNLCKS